jgi:peptidoglycan/xylan/chitin deacetylase (PgdA/CDA1 family)
MLIAVNFHYIRPSFDYRYPGIHGITPGQLKDQLTLLGKTGVFVSAGQIRDALREGAQLPDKALVVTFDDGLREQYDMAWPILQRLGIPAIFFVNTAPIAHATILSVHKIHLIRAHFDPGQVATVLHQNARRLGVGMDMRIDDTKVLSQYKYDNLETARLKYLLNFLLAPADRDHVIEASFQELFPNCEAEMSRGLYMDIPHIQALANRGCIGTHTHEHLPLGVIPADMAREQIQVASTYFHQWIGETPFVLSYPYGSLEACSLEVGEIAKDSGIEFAFTMERAANVDLQRPLFLSRFSSSDLPGGNASKWSIDELFLSQPASSWHRRNRGTARTDITPSPVHRA